MRAAASSKTSARGCGAEGPTLLDQVINTAVQVVFSLVGQG